MISNAIVTLFGVDLGLVVGWTSPYLAKLTNNESVLQITNDEASWVVSLVPFGRLFGAVIGSMAMEYYGSKKSLLATGLSLIIGWIGIIFANSAAWLYVSRFSSGISQGMFYSCFALYMGEIASPNIRGALVSTIVNGLPLGTLIGNIMGPYMSMMCFGIISLVVNVCFIVVFPFLPQSPHYYVRRENSVEAKKAIQWYQRKSNVNVELEMIEDFVRSSKSLNFRDKLRQIVQKKNRRVFSIIIFLFIFMQMSGMNTIVFYMEIIVRNAKVTSIDPAAVVMISNAIGIVVGWISVYCIDRCGRRILLAVSSACLVLATLLLGLHFMLLDLNYDPKNFEWLPILAMILYMLMFIGLVPVPSTLLSEMFPDDLKSIAGFTAGISSGLFAFISSRTYQPMVDLMSEKYVFWLYAIIMTVCFFYCLIAVPETKGKTLQEIQDMLAAMDEQEKPNLETKTKCDSKH
ncbi:facilitated trehalose transporter Tret1-like [Ceratina calcarata]|uniref:Facilitated trehalose transporter Tret1-like n=1 Tax=Ceratina calcarata TaxID=156304 RepID=A0AAJ7S9R6_9HYME|nr:facilitated trehalose transporter Tret1-like [Ceratina calcarata]